jgi:hypothetical protein
MNKEKIVSILIGSVLATFLALVVINGFFMSYFLTFRSPVIIQMPIQVHKRVEPLSPTPTPKKVKVTLTPTATPTPKLKVDIKKIYQLESSGGKNDGCRNKGLYNGYGYIPGNCYGTLEEVESLVRRWFEEKLKTYDLATALCGYNLGFQSHHLKECVNKSNNYPYYRDYLALSN